MTKSREWGYLSRRINKSLNPKVEYRGDGGEKPDANLLKRFLWGGGSLWIAQMSKVWVRLVWNSDGYLRIKTYSVFFF